ncbi:hypothetical protein ACJMK2_010078 [Sinanodonta woodiana]|uniref:AB hydrolase-1 domain-containing protein n=1 Tax=Sinanodonta woodiana TaxID=1069815 RepID=A0ABD3VFU2_SINWO
MATIMKLLFGPRLFRILRTDTTEGKMYEPNIIESGGNKVISTLRFCWSLSYWTSPFLMAFLYRRGFFSSEGLTTIARFLLYVSIFYVTAVLMRGIGRCTNPDYIAFTTVLIAAQRSFTESNRRLLARYDYEFWASPISFRWDQVNSGGSRRTMVQAGNSEPGSFSIKTIPSSILGYIAIHTVGRRLIFPGATSLMNALIEPALIQARAKLVEEKNGQRAKLLTEDNNEIDTMFFDRRGIAGKLGKTLVISCEGNAGYYEIGSTVTPLDAGYSVLGWNHPGFAGSSGVPFPEQEQKAVDTVMQYAINKLGFTPDNIVLFAWSIGGYSATWAAMNYPDVKYVVLDATFDDLGPLAVAKMPEYFSNLVFYSIKKYFDLNNVAQLCKYPGPVLLIRRSRDEVITTKDPLSIFSNRGNDLLIQLLQYRYPNIVDSTTVGLLREWVANERTGQADLLSEHQVEPNFCESVINSYVEAHSFTYPLEVGEGLPQAQKNQLALFLASKYMEDFDSTHCSPLPTSFLHEPWSPKY